MKGGRFRTLWKNEKKRVAIVMPYINEATTLSILYEWWGGNSMTPPTAVEYEGVLRRIYGLRDIGGGLFSAVLGGLDAPVVLRDDIRIHEVRDTSKEIIIDL